MKLESLDEMEENQQFFCSSCGKQLEAADEILHHLCYQCKQTQGDRNEEDTFFCWACGKHLLQMGEVAQGLCHACKASIVRKIHDPLKNLLSPSKNNDRR